MHVRRIASSLVLGVATLASIATSAPQVPPGYQVDDVETIDAIAPVDPAPTVFAITAESSRAPGLDEGDLTVTLELRPNPETGDVPSLVIVTLTSERDPSLTAKETVLVEQATGTQAVFLTLPAWETCELGPCVDDYRLEVQNSGPNVPVLVGGELRAALHGEQPDPPAGATVTLTVTGP